MKQAGAFAHRTTIERLHAIAAYAQRAGLRFVLFSSNESSAAASAFIKSSGVVAELVVSYNEFLRDREFNS